MTAAAPPWLRRGADGSVTLTLHIQPGAKKTEVAGVHGDALKLRLAAPPVDGKANAALLAFVAERLGVAKAAVVLKSGQTSRRKVVEIDSPPPDIPQRLLPD
ncbi:MAG: YggU family protein [Rhodocyclales bacterium]|nr:YggU family protein [Rhodocyclales bacterium]